MCYLTFKKAISVSGIRLKGDIFITVGQRPTESARFRKTACKAGLKQESTAFQAVLWGDIHTVGR